MTDKELIQALRYCGTHPVKCKSCPYSGVKVCVDMMKNDAADRLEALLAENEHLREVTKMVPRWVSVSERLPKNNDNQVLVVVNGIYNRTYFHDAVEIAEFVPGEGWILEGWPDWENPSMTYWQPLPEPPSTEGVE